MRPLFTSILFFLLFVCFYWSCNVKKNETSSNDKTNLSDFNIEVKQHVKNKIDSNITSFTILSDSINLNYFEVAKSFYSNSNFIPIWIDGDSLHPRAIEFAHFLDTSIYIGLFKNDYQFESIKKKYYKN